MHRREILVLALKMKALQKKNWRPGISMFSFDHPKDEHFFPRVSEWFR